MIKLVINIKEQNQQSVFDAKDQVHSLFSLNLSNISKLNPVMKSKSLF